jgi:alkylation response protein AidB-like acyl-CoA dehydrogenase
MTMPSDRPGLLDELLAAVASVRPVLEESAVASEESGCLTEPAVAALRAAKLFRLCWPEKLGGYEAPPLIEFEVVAAVAYADTSAGWNLGVGSTHTGMAGAYLSPDAVDEIFGGAVEPNVAGQLAPLGRARKSNGGYVASGRLSFASGIHQSEWVAAGCVVEADGGGQPELRLMILPRKSVQVHDTWHVAGLKGTGSCDYSFEEVVVPEGFSCSFPAPEPLRGGSRFRPMISPQVSPFHAGFAIGAGQRAIDEIAAFAASKHRLGASKSVAERESFQRDLGSAGVALDAARLYARDAIGRMDATSRANGPVSPELATELHAMAAHATRVALDAASMAFRHAGASGLFSTSPLQRVLRDLLAASQHFFVADSHLEAYGRQLLEQPPIRE